MLRDMLGDQALKKAFASYHPADDKEPSYMPRSIQAQTQRDLEWFFDDWVYRDRGLPDFKVASAFTRKTLPEGYMLTITVENIGSLARRFRSRSSSMAEKSPNAWWYAAKAMA